MSSCCKIDQSIQIPKQWSDVDGDFAFKLLAFTENAAEFIDEGFHLIGKSIKIYVGEGLYHIGQRVHDIAHSGHNFLHAVCFLNDIYQIAKGAYVVPKKAHHVIKINIRDLVRRSKDIDFVKTTARVCHSIGHFFVFFVEGAKQLGKPLEPLNPVIKCARIFTISGYAISTVSLVWNKFNDAKNCDTHTEHSHHHGEHCHDHSEKMFSQHLIVNLSGIVVESIMLADDFGLIGPIPRLFKVASVAALISSTTIMMCLWPKTPALTSRNV